MKSLNSKQLQQIIKLVKTKPLIVLIVGGLLVGLIFFGLSTPNVSSKKPEVAFEKPKLESVERAVDPRALWTENIIAEIKKSEQDMVGSLDSARKVYSEKLAKLTEQINSLKNKLETEKEQPVEVNTTNLELAPARKHLVHLSQTYAVDKKKM